MFVRILTNFKIIFVYLNTNFKAIRKQLADKTSEISELKIKLDELRKLGENEKNAVDECKKYYITRLNQKNNELEKYKA